MSAFALDTSGAVLIVTAEDHGTCATRLMRWPDLDPFTQGYVEALLEACWRQEYGRAAANDRCFGWNVAFSDLAPETLAAILKDCGAYSTPFAGSATAAGGAEFWRYRQLGMCKNFKPLTPYLGDDGRVYLREAA